MLTSAQASTLKTTALADPVAAALLNTGNDAGLAEWFNTSGTYIVWRSSLTPDLARAAIVQGASQLDSLTVGKRDALLYVTSGTLNVQESSVRAAIDDLCGSQNILKSALQAAQKRPATRAEAALAAGSGTTASPSLMGWEGYINIYSDAPQIREAA